MAKLPLIQHNSDATRSSRQPDCFSEALDRQISHQPRQSVSRLNKTPTAVSSKRKSISSKEGSRPQPESKYRSNQASA